MSVKARQLIALSAALLALAGCNSSEEEPSPTAQRVARADARQLKLVKQYLQENYADAPWFAEVFPKLKMDTGELSVELDREPSPEANKLAKNICRALDKADQWQRKQTNNAIVPISVWSVPGNQQLPPEGCEYFLTHGEL